MRDLSHFDRNNPYKPNAPSNPRTLASNTHLSTTGQNHRFHVASYVSKSSSAGALAQYIPPFSGNTLQLSNLSPKKSNSLNSPHPLAQYSPVYIAQSTSNTNNLTRSPTSREGYNQNPNPKPNHRKRDTLDQINNSPKRPRYPIDRNITGGEEILHVESIKERTDLMSSKTNKNISNSNVPIIEFGDSDFEICDDEWDFSTPYETPAINKNINEVTKPSKNSPILQDRIEITSPVKDPLDIFDELSVSSDDDNDESYHKRHKNKDIEAQLTNSIISESDPEIIVCESHESKEVTDVFDKSIPLFSDEDEDEDDILSISKALKERKIKEKAENSNKADIKKGEKNPDDGNNSQPASDSENIQESAITLNPPSSAFSFAFPSTGLLGSRKLSSLRNPGNSATGRLSALSSCKSGNTVISSAKGDFHVNETQNHGEINQTYTVPKQISQRSSGIINIQGSSQNSFQDLDLGASPDFVSNDNLLDDLNLGKSTASNMSERLKKFNSGAQKNIIKSINSIVNDETASATSKDNEFSFNTSENSLNLKSPIKKVSKLILLIVRTKYSWK